MAIEPTTGALVTASSHPSTLQFYSPASDRLLMELEISPTNRAFRAEEAFIEPTRVERIAFSTPARAGGSRSAASSWLAVLQSRRAGEGQANEQVLSFWQWLPASAKSASSSSNSSKGRYSLVTRIERPHDDEVNAMKFTPAGGAGALLATSSADGSVRFWSLSTVQVKGGRQEAFWSLRSVLTHRAQAPRDMAFSPDGALLVAAQGTSVALWDTISSSLRLVVEVPELDSAEKVGFGGPGGRFLAVAGGSWVTVRDLLSKEILLRRRFAGSIEHLWPIAGAAGAGEQQQQQQQQDVAFGVAFKRLRPQQASHAAPPASTLIAHLSPSKGRAKVVGALPFTLRALLPSATGQQDYAISTAFDVVQLGKKSQRPFAAAAATRSLASVSIARRSLFEDLFGRDEDSSEVVDQLEESAAAAASRAGAASGQAGAVVELFSGPTHLLPSMDHLFAPFLRQLLPPRPHEAGDRDGAKDAAAAASRGAEEDEEGDEAMQTSEARVNKSLDEIASADLSALTERFGALWTLEKPRVAPVQAPAASKQTTAKAKASAAAADTSVSSVSSAAAVAASGNGNGKANGKKGTSPAKGQGQGQGQANGKRRRESMA